MDLRTKSNWVERLACPDCHQHPFKMLCLDCERHFSRTEDGIYQFMPAWEDMPFQNVEQRYDTFAARGHTFKRTDPVGRAIEVANLLSAYGIREYLDIGAGQGILESVTPEMAKAVLDVSIGYLRAVKETAPETFLVHGVGETIPFLSESIQCVVADGVIQATVDKKATLKEIFRVVPSRGLVVIGIFGQHMYDLIPMVRSYGNHEMTKYFDTGLQVESSEKDSDQVWVLLRKE